jgi:hypothetical protein
MPEQYVQLHELLLLFTATALKQDEMVAEAKLRSPLTETAETGAGAALIEALANVALRSPLLTHAVGTRELAEFAAAGPEQREALVQSRLRECLPVPPISPRGRSHLSKVKLRMLPSEEHLLVLGLRRFSSERFGDICSHFFAPHLSEYQLKMRFKDALQGGTGAPDSDDSELARLGREALGRARAREAALADSPAVATAAGATTPAAAAALPATPAGEAHEAATPATQPGSAHSRAPSSATLSTTSPRPRASTTLFFHEPFSTREDMRMGRALLSLGPNFAAISTAALPHRGPAVVAARFDEVLATVSVIRAPKRVKQKSTGVQWNRELDTALTKAYLEHVVSARKECWDAVLDATNSVFSVDEAISRLKVLFVARKLLGET